MAAVLADLGGGRWWARSRASEIRIGPVPRRAVRPSFGRKPRNNSSSQYGVCDTCLTDDPSSCQTFFNVHKRHWDSAENGRPYDWCESRWCRSCTKHGDVCCPHYPSGACLSL